MKKELKDFASNYLKDGKDRPDTVSITRYSYGLRMRFVIRFRKGNYEVIGRINGLSHRPDKPFPESVDATTYITDTSITMKMSFPYCNIRSTKIELDEIIAIELDDMLQHQTEENLVAEMEYIFFNIKCRISSDDFFRIKNPYFENFI